MLFKVLEYKAKNKRNKETLLSCLADLFYSIFTQKRKVGTIAPKKFIARLRKEKVEFDNYMQQVGTWGTHGRIGELFREWWWLV